DDPPFTRIEAGTDEAAHRVHEERVDLVELDEVSGLARLGGIAPWRESQRVDSRDPRSAHLGCSPSGDVLPHRRSTRTPVTTSAPAPAGRSRTAETRQ